MADSDREELVTLRVAVARVAQALGVDNALSVTGKAFSELSALARTEGRGWNALAALCAEEAQRRGETTG